ncbi:hypothetical protein QUF73_01660 [Cytobacillus sp. NJ13]|nr:hypothetical protein [Cytobacillus sp. NJ13]
MLLLTDKHPKVADIPIFTRLDDETNVLFNEEFKKKQEVSLFFK